MSRWYAVNTHPHQEDRAERNLQRQGYATFLPVQRKTRRHARRIDTVRATLFPSYMFVSLDIETQAWSPINSSYGVRRIIHQNGRPAALPDRFVAGLQGATDEDGFVVEDVETFKIGDRLRILAGPFADRIGAMVRLPAGDRITVMLDLLGREVQVSAPRNAITAA